MVQLANRVEHAKKRKENGRQFLISRFTPSLLPPKILKKKKKKKKNTRSHSHSTTASPLQIRLSRNFTEQKQSHIQTHPLFLPLYIYVLIHPLFPYRFPSLS